MKEIFNCSLNLTDVYSPNTIKFGSESLKHRIMITWGMHLKLNA